MPFEAPSGTADLVAVLRAAGCDSVAEKLKGEAAATEPLSAGEADDILAALSGNPAEVAAGWQRVLARAPTSVALQRETIAAFLRAEDPVGAFAALPADSVWVRHWSASDGALPRLLQAAEAQPEGAPPETLWRFLSETAAEPSVCVAALLAMAPQSVRRLVQSLADGRIAGAPAARVVLADQLAICNLGEDAAILFDRVAASIPLDFHLALLGARIAAQVGDEAALAQRFALADAAARANPALLHASALFDPVALLAATHAHERETRLAAMAQRLSQPGRDAEIVCHFILCCPRPERLADALCAVSARVADETTQRLLRAVGLALCGETPTEDALWLAAAGALRYPKVFAALFDRVLSPEVPLAQFDAALAKLDPKDDATRADLRSRAAALHGAGAFERAARVARRITASWPGEHWARIHAIDAAHQSGDLTAARDLARAFPLGDAQGEVVADIGFAMAKVGLVDEASSVFQRADRELRDGAVPARVAQVLARGFAFTGNPERALDWYERAHGDARPSVTTAGRPVVLDPGYRDGAGHHPNHGRFAAGVLASAFPPHAPLIVVGQKTEARDLAPYDVAGLTVFEPYMSNAFQITERAVLSLNETFRADLARTFASGRPPVIFVHSMRLTMLLGFLRWLAQSPVGRATLAIIDVIEVDLLADHRLAALGEAIRQTAEAIASRSDLRLLAFGESDAGAAYLAHALPRETVHKFPYLAAARLAPLAQQPPRSDAPVFGMLGATRRERGHDTFLAAAMKVAERRAAGATFVVQIDASAFDAFGPDHAPLLARARAERSVRLLPGTLSAGEYDEAFCGLDSVVLPYRGRYAVSGSGVLFEAITANRHVIVPRGSTLGDELAAYGYPHALMDAGDPGSLAAAMAKTAADWPRIAEALTRFRARGVPLPFERFMAALDAARDGLWDGHSVPPGADEHPSAAPASTPFTHQRGATR